jgi:hypothetical protein
VIKVIKECELAGNAAVGTYTVAISNICIL